MSGWVRWRTVEQVRAEVLHELAALLLAHAQREAVLRRDEDRLVDRYGRRG